MASKKESNFINMVLTLFIVSAIAAFALGGVYTLTKEPIALAQKQKLENAIKVVLPDFDNIKTIKAPSGDGGDSLILYIGSKNDKIVGTAVKTYTMKGFGGLVELMVGFNPDGSIFNTSVLSHKETPGLGDKMDVSKSNFPIQFKGKNPATYKLKVKKDGGDVDAITAATISSRAFCDAVQRAYNTFEIEEKSN